MQEADADVRRECVLKSLIIYLGECVEDLIKEYTMSQIDQAKQELDSTTMAVFVFRENSSLLQQPKEIGIIIDGVEVLTELPSVAAGVGFRFTFEALQKILMDGSNKMSSKIRKLNETESKITGGRQGASGRGDGNGRQVGEGQETGKQTGRQGLDDRRQ
ncbi:unnamed protein product [Boreogadus saida]